ncbi:MAG: CsbD family protein [Rhodanobacteraceae bacterium]
MNQDILLGRWKQLIGHAQQKLARWRNDDRLGLQGSHDCLLGLLQEHYGQRRKLVEVRVREIEREL